MGFEQSAHPASKTVDRSPRYPLWVRVIAGLIRLPARAFLPPIRISRKIMAVVRQGSEHVLKDMERSQGFYVWVSFLVALIFLGGYALLMSLIHSMEILEFYTNIPWEMMVSNYIFLVGSSV